MLRGQVRGALWEGTGLSEAVEHLRASGGEAILERHEGVLEAVRRSCGNSSLRHSAGE